MYHCNVDSQGNVRLALLQSWSPATSMHAVLEGVLELLAKPRPEEALVPAIADQLQRDPREHDRTARDWVRRFASI